ncbi:hypothetical protein BaRGS_00016485 [Batillaria attramentaria]|uniref:Secreted protein n=1 Tax=Batillaria attramentaria TaxID=370345 RepID=A0ABD0KY30_9CAEN
MAMPCRNTPPGAKLSQLFHFLFFVQSTCFLRAPTDGGKLRGFFTVPGSSEVWCACECLADRIVIRSFGGLMNQRGGEPTA